VEWTTRDSYEPARGCVRRFRFEPTEQEPTSSSRFEVASRSWPLLLGDQRSHAAEAEWPLADDRNRTQAATPPASGDTRANTNAGIGPDFTRDVLVATSAHLVLAAFVLAAGSKQ
jgi:hypothetical protein